MLVVKYSTKKGKALVNGASRNCGTYLWNCYESFSTAKEKAYEYCRQLCAEENGTDFHISSYNCNTFTVAWNSPEGVRIETAYSSYLIPEARFELCY